MSQRKPQPAMYCGIGYCAYADCPQYDGKRCMMLGFAPSPICEPWVRELVALNLSLAERVEKQAELLSKKAEKTP